MIFVLFLITNTPKLPYRFPGRHLFNFCCTLFYEDPHEYSFLHSVFVYAKCHLWCHEKAPEEYQRELSRMPWWSHHMQDDKGFIMQTCHVFSAVSEKKYDTYIFSVPSEQCYEKWSCSGVYSAVGKVGIMMHITEVHIAASSIFAEFYIDAGYQTLPY